MKPINRRRLPLDTAALAVFLLGRLVVRNLNGRVLSGRIVETEAYTPDEEASHTYRGQTPRNASMFLSRGHAYVYFVYGANYMLNVSSGEEGVGAGVLIRALEPVDGVAAMQKNRGKERLIDLTRGPGCLAQALAIDRSLDGVDMCAPGPLWLADDGVPAPAHAKSVRIGLTRSADVLRRFYIPGNRFVSGRRDLRRRS